jgi:ubiquitin-like modifier-activating enzyme ATG7
VFEDSTGGGRLKAEQAAKELKRIFPDIESEGYALEIPMPGHFATHEEQFKSVLDSARKIEELVQAHDVLYLLTDSREARWFPTVLANVYNKICITVGLGFDSYTIVRHGASSRPKQNEAENKPSQRLPCYFCSDIAAPGNTTSDRTLDRQCTVTRPGKLI